MYALMQCGGNILIKYSSMTRSKGARQTVKWLKWMVF